MKHIKPVVLLVSVFFFIVLMIPTLLVVSFGDKTDGKLTEKKTSESQKVEMKQTNLGPQIEVAVYRMSTKKVATLPLEEYVVGVVASEMPADFEVEALKAQSLAARTYIVQKMLSGNIGKKLPGGAHVSDTVTHQVYKSADELKVQWQGDYNWKMEKVRKAVQETAGQILTFENQPISAQFFSTSNGYTENSEEYWSNPFPYLQSVESPWDKEAPSFTDQKVVSVKEFEQQLGIKIPTDGSLGKVVARTTGKRIASIEIGGKTLTGKEVREKLDLRSADFNWAKKGNQIVITTKGSGHGVGMSQYGANGMAVEGKSYKQIVEYYYKGVSIALPDQYVSKLTAKQ
ncbi:stage II sporulation protein D [Metabacillus iocasae]|uniref:Stage II sporulation protein D n=1 Tax=Priestia iocasae TaxID=2291674 RepID=A0ABS2QYH6_9BACI|nr:stage II sporulation protein D [Metabacillus iocasae]MBM7704032.1 stage II sporulation protein D [Metabacillus iocasae]